MYRLINNLTSYFLSENKNLIKKNIGLMLGFGILSFSLGFIRFYIPGMSGAGSDMREIGMLLSVIFFPNSIYVLGVSLIGSFSLPFNNLEISTILMHLISTQFAWFFYDFIKRRVKSALSKGILWFILVTAYYLVFLIPTLVIVLYFFNEIQSNEIINSYIKILYEYRIEFFTTLTITSLTLIILKFIKALKKKNTELKQALIKAEESDKLKTSFLNNLSHEIRTPLNIIMGVTDLLNEGSIDQIDQIEFMKMIRSSGDQLIATIDNILDLSAIEAEQYILKKSTVNIDETIEHIALYFKTLAKEKGIDFSVIKEPDTIETSFFTNKSKLTQVINSILDNAFKYTQSGSVQLLYSIDKHKAVFTIKDTGIGIDPIYFEKIFARFYKIEHNNELYPGTGVGLAVAKGIVNLLGGNISVQSELGKWSEFSFILPNSLQE